MNLMSNKKLGNLKSTQCSTYLKLMIEQSLIIKSRSVNDETNDLIVMNPTNISQNQNCTKKRLCCLLRCYLLVFYGKQSIC